MDTYQFENNLAREDSNFTGSYGLQFKFAVPSWRETALTGDRTLQEVHLWGNHQGASTGGKIKVRATHLLLAICLADVPCRHIRHL